MVNPYEFDDSLDDDLFGEETQRSHKHTIDGTVCPTCDIIHSTPEGIPDSALDKIMGFIDKLPDEVAKGILSSGRMKPPKYAEMMTMIISFTTHMDETNQLGPLLRAIVEHLDEKTDGKITKRWRVYEVERRLLATHYAMKAITDALQDARAQEADAEFIALLDMMGQFMCDRVEYLKDAYITETQGESDYKPVEDIINTGTYPEDMHEKVKYLMLDDMLYELDE